MRGKGGREGRIVCGKGEGKVEASLKIKWMMVEQRSRKRVKKTVKKVRKRGSSGAKCGVRVCGNVEIL